MLASKLQELLIRRVDFIQNLLLLHSYAELLTLKLDKYRGQHRLMNEKENLMVETYRNVFRVNEHYRKLLHNTFVACFRRINPNFRARVAQVQAAKPFSVFREFVNFFKMSNEWMIVQGLRKMQEAKYNENELLIELAKLMIYYLKVHTERVLDKLANKELALLKEFKVKEEAQDKMDISQDKQAKKTANCRRFVTVFLRKPQAKSSRGRKYHSEEKSPERMVMTGRHSFRQATQPPEVSAAELQNADNTRAKLMDWKVRLRRFQDVYSREWGKLYKMVEQEELQELKTKERQYSGPKKSWIVSNYPHLTRQLLQRNASIHQTISSYKEEYQRRRSARAK